MKSVLVVGLGRFGRHMAVKLIEEGNEVLAVDINEERVNDALDLVTNAQIGDTTNEHFIASLGVWPSGIIFRAPWRPQRFSRITGRLCPLKGKQGCARKVSSQKRSGQDSLPGTGDGRTSGCQIRHR